MCTIINNTLSFTNNKFKFDSTKKNFVIKNFIFNGFNNKIRLGKYKNNKEVPQG